LKENLITLQIIDDYIQRLREIRQASIIIKKKEVLHEKEDSIAIDMQQTSNY
jgi:hypothetical protein